MRRHVGPIGLVLLVAALGTPASAGGNANFILGGRSLSDGANWGSFDSQSVFAADVDFSVGNWPVNLEAGVQASEKEESFFGTNVTGSVTELFVGVNRTWDHGKMHPFVGGGAASVTAGFDGGGVSEDDTSAGFYIHGGVFWRIGRRINLGLDVRAMTGTSLTLFGLDGDADYTQGGLLLGWGWPAGK